MAGFNNTPVSIELGGAEIVSWVPGANVAAVCGGDSTVRFVKYDANFQNPEVVLEKEFEGSVQSVAAFGSYIAVAESPSKTEEGSVSVFRFNKRNELRQKFTANVGFLPDSIDWSSDGKKIVVANEGEPSDYYGTSDGVDPKGSVSIISLKSNRSLKRTKTLGFDGFSAQQLSENGVRLSGENANNPARDIEPEFVKITPDSKRAVVTLQENNAMVVVNLGKGNFEMPVGLGAKDWAGLSVDTSNEDGGYLPGDRDFKSLYMPDGMDVFTASNGTTYAVMANEGDGRVRPDDLNFEADIDGTFTLHKSKKEGSVAEIQDPLTGKTVYVHRDMRGKNSTAFEAEAGDELFITWKFGAVADDDFYSDEKRAGKLDGPQGNSIVSGDGEGRLKTVVDQNTADSITGFGGRSFTIRHLDGSIVWDSGDDLDRIAAEYGVYDDERSDDKGVEPEHVSIFNLDDRSFAAISLERGTSTLIPVYEITNVDAPEHVYTFHAANSISPEATAFVKTSANGGTLLVSSEVSGTLDAFNFSTTLV